MSQVEQVDGCAESNGALKQIRVDQCKTILTINSKSENLKLIELNVCGNRRQQIVINIVTMQAVKQTFNGNVGRVINIAN